MEAGFAAGGVMVAHGVFFPCAYFGILLSGGLETMDRTDIGWMVISEKPDRCLLNVRHGLICNLHACMVSEVANCRVVHIRILGTHV